MRGNYEALAKGYEIFVLDDETGEQTRVPQQPLLQQVREAIFGGLESTGGTGGFQSKMPIAAAALDLYEQIDHEISQVWASCFPTMIPGIDSPETLLSQIYAASTGDEMHTVRRGKQRVDGIGTPAERWSVEYIDVDLTTIRLFEQWATQIRDFFDPPSLAEIKAPCIQCEEEFAWKNVDGERIRYRVLAFKRDKHGRSYEAYCSACHTSWPESQYKFLVQAIADAEKARKAAERAKLADKSEV